MTNKNKTNIKIIKKKLFKIKIISFLFGVFLFGFYFCLTNIIRIAWGLWAESCFNFFILSIFSGFIWWICEDNRFDE